MKLTKNILREKHRIFNPHNLATATKTRVFIDYTPMSVLTVSSWEVINIDSDTGHSRHRSFVVFRRQERNEKLTEAMLWASKKYIIEEWERSPFGSYHPRGTMAQFDR